MCRTCRAAARTKTCPVCSTRFLPHASKQATQIACSKSCGRKVNALGRKATWQAQNRRRRALLRQARSTSYTTTDIAERDNHTCQLCHDPVDMTIAWPDPRSPSIDHVLALSRGGDDTPANVQLAHLACNTRKGRGLRVSDAMA